MLKKDDDLTSLPNIGSKLAEKLKQVGIESPRSLKSIGSENAFARIKAIDCNACLASIQWIKIT